MKNSHLLWRSNFANDLTAGLVVFLVALPLCLGVALASNTPLFSGLLAGIIGGVVVGLLSGSQTSISGPAAGLAAVVATQVAFLGSYQTFLLALVLAGLIQVILGISRAGFIAAFFPSSVIKGLLAAIGILLILKQIPHVLGRNLDSAGGMAFFQLDNGNTLSSLVQSLGAIHPGAATVGVCSLVFLLAWNRWPTTKRSLVPAPLIVVMIGVGMSFMLRRLGGEWAIGTGQLVQVPIADRFADYLEFLQHPDFSQWSNRAVYISALTIAAVASLESLLNLEAVDKLDPHQRDSPPSRELVAQGIGNILAGLIGGLPITSVIARSSVNINAGARTKLSAVVQGLLILISILLLPTWLNQIPLSCLAAILLVTGLSLASPARFVHMWKQGLYQFVPFIVTVVAIVLTDLLAGVMIGLAASVGFILTSSMRRPIRQIIEKHLSGEVVHIELSEQVSFLNRAALAKALDQVPRNGHVLLDATITDYIDPDLLDMIREFEMRTAPARGIEVSMVGFQSRYAFRDRTRYVDYSTREIQGTMTPEQVLQILKDGHERFRNGQQLTRDFGRQIKYAAKGQHPLAVVLSCIDSRTPAELVFDTGVGDIFSVRIAGNITSRKILGSLEYACAVAGVKLVLVMGHTRCGAVTTAVKLACTSESASALTGCQHLDPIIREIQQSVDIKDCEGLDERPAAEQEAIIDGVARRNVMRVIEAIREQSETLDNLAREGRIAIVGAVYDVASAQMEYLSEVAPDPVAAS